MAQVAAQEDAEHDPAHQSVDDLRVVPLSGHLGAGLLGAEHKAQGHEDSESMHRDGADRDLERLPVVEYRLHPHLLVGGSANPSLAREGKLQAEPRTPAIMIAQLQPPPVLVCNGGADS